MNEPAPSVLISGASRGLGRDMALSLAHNGFQVLAGVRRPEDGNRLREETTSIQPIVLDVTDSTSIDDAVETVEAIVGAAGLSALVNNAGAFAVAPLEQQSLQELEELFQVNVFGVVALTKAMLPLLRKAKGRVLNISSINGKLSLPFFGGYCASKFALEALSDALRGELRPFGVPVAVIEPGTMATDIRVKGAESWERAREDLADADKVLYARAFEGVKAAVQSWESETGAPQEISEAVLTALTDPEPRTRYAAGPMMDQLPGLLSLSDVERDAMFAQMLGLQAD